MRILIIDDDDLPLDVLIFALSDACREPVNVRDGCETSRSWLNRDSR